MASALDILPMHLTPENAQAAEAHRCPRGSSLRDLADCEIMDPMLSKLRSKVFDALWEDVGPAFVARLGDLTLAAMMWIGIGVLHFVQLAVLSFGWSPSFVHYLDVAEEYTVFVTVVAYFLSSTVAFFWATYRRMVGGMK